MNSELKLRSQKLAFLLRHDTGYAFDEHGWRDIDDLIRNHGYTMTMLEEIVTTNNKQRYEFNDDKTAIRARQGHSVKVDVELKEAIPPLVLFHGTAAESLSSILEEGLRAGSTINVNCRVADLEVIFVLLRRSVAVAT